MNYTPKLHKREDSRKYKCGIGDCINFHLRDDLLPHLRREHPNTLIDEHESTEVWNGVNIWGGKYYLCYGELFKRYVRRTQQGAIEFVLQIYGLDKLARHYKYDICLIDETSSSNTLPMTGRCDSYETKKYMITINPERAKPFIQNNRIKYNTKIVIANHDQ